MLKSMKKNKTIEDNIVNFSQFDVDILALSVDDKLRNRVEGKGIIPLNILEFKSLFTFLCEYNYEARNICYTDKLYSLIMDCFMLSYSKINTKNHEGNCYYANKIEHWYQSMKSFTYEDVISDHGIDKNRTLELSSMIKNDHVLESKNKYIDDHHSSVQVCLTYLRDEKISQLTLDRFNSEIVGIIDIYEELERLEANNKHDILLDKLKSFPSLRVDNKYINLQYIYR
jgi:hypothetical protein